MNVYSLKKLKQNTIEGESFIVDVVKNLLQICMLCIVVVHNHPSGRLEPSKKVEPVLPGSNQGFNLSEAAGPF